ncbi:hypothetical protein T07_2997 [Trichinella nelsoni]|uniref:Uncharacterized protein n=1 Tax=Trichinella nelsoni TaxID=6336 RepID=A0A0V0SG65_9BILA|nr:hypothetical protein T07_2997 [Trichinella nelsoni]
MYPIDQSYYTLRVNTQNVFLKRNTRKWTTNAEQTTTTGDGVDEPLETLGRVAQDEGHLEELEKAEGHLEELEKAEGCCDRGLRYVLGPHRNVVVSVC